MRPSPKSTFFPYTTLFRSGVRLVSYAMHWIKAEIHEYILKNWRMRSEEHTSELQSRFDRVCRLLHEKNKAAADRYQASQDQQAEYQDLRRQKKSRPQSSDG